MKKPTVANRHHLGKDWPPGAVYIGRKSKLSAQILAAGRCADGTALGNPFKPQDFQTPEGCLEAYRGRLWTGILRDSPGIMAALAMIRALDAPVLVCSCKPEPCHGDVIAEDWTYIIDALDEEE